MQENSRLPPLSTGLHATATVPNVVIEQGFALPPEGPGLGTRLKAELFDARRETYRVTRSG